MLNTAVIIIDSDRQYEGLMTCIGLQLNDIQVKMFVLNSEIENMDEAYRENMMFFKEVGGECYSNNQVNVEEYGFSFKSLQEVGNGLKEIDRVIPF
jgi:hypothetical protein